MGLARELPVALHTYAKACLAAFAFLLCLLSFFCCCRCCMCRRPVCRWDSLQDPVSIVLIGKYTVLSDAYLSVLKALQVRPLPVFRTPVSARCTVFA